MEENTAQRRKAKLIMPEYGRNIQQMVQYAYTIEDRAERTRCARTIIDIMGNLFPYLRDIDDFKHKLWDHLYIMSDCRLDIDYPFEVKQPESRPKPEKIPHRAERIKYRHYGRWIEALIATAAAQPESEQRTELIRLIANNMKKDYVNWNKELADDGKIFDDLREMSHGSIDIPSDTMTLAEARHTNNGGHYKNNQKKQKNGQRHSAK